MKVTTTVVTLRLFVYWQIKPNFCLRVDFRNANHYHYDSGVKDTEILSNLENYAEIRMKSGVTLLVLMSLFVSQYAQATSLIVFSGRKDKFIKPRCSGVHKRKRYQGSFTLR